MQPSGGFSAGAVAAPAAPARSAGPLAIPAGVVALVGAALIPGTSSVALLLGIAAAFVLLTLSSPAWALAAVLLAEQAIPGYIPGTVISVRLAVTLVAVAVALPAVLRGLRESETPLQ